MHFNTVRKRQRLTYERYYSNARYEPFPPFLYPQGDVARSEWRHKKMVRDPRVFDRCFRCAHRRQRRRFLGSLYLGNSRAKLCLFYERQRTTTPPPPAQESFWNYWEVVRLFFWPSTQCSARDPKRPFNPAHTGSLLDKLLTLDNFSTFRIC